MEKDFQIRREDSVLSAGAAEPYDAVVFGSTGAVGKEVVRSLARSEQCRSVVAIVRCDTAFRVSHIEAAAASLLKSDYVTEWI